MFLNTTTEYTQTQTLTLDIDSKVGYTLAVTHSSRLKPAPESLKRAMFRTSSIGIAKALNRNNNG